MSNPLIQIGDEVREMNEAEFAQYEKDLSTAETEKQLEATKAAAKAAALAKLEALGLNEADLTALGL